MKNLLLTFALIFTTLVSFSQDSQKTITVTIDNVNNDKGTVKMALNTADTFMKGKPIMSAESAIKDGKVTITFENVEPGEYAIIAYHDVNENNKMDFSDNGMPLESYGMSNNSMSFGPPQYDEAKFKVEDKNLELNIRF
ncbi:DUF2141 domain-containing protein [Winogradskyella schleiferi]|uniref:DUF2141 domain-containing protein n=1 Tax=Winogradskyella schleiferi TaxID=2686078 RepID=UPI0015B95F3D|nr:DUF2141 domain-containing protein [Winogradskyella schleiferi]